MIDPVFPPLSPPYPSHHSSPPSFFSSSFVAHSTLVLFSIPFVHPSHSSIRQHPAPSHHHRWPYRRREDARGRRRRIFIFRAGPRHPQAHRTGENFPEQLASICRLFSGFFFLYPFLLLLLLSFSPFFMTSSTSHWDRYGCRRRALLDSRIK